MLAASSLVPFAPFAKILAPIHNGRKITGNGKLRQYNFTITQQNICILEKIYHLHSSCVGQSDLQVKKPVPCLFAGTAGMLLGICLQFMIPAFALIYIQQHGMQKTKSCHQKQGCTATIR